MKTEVVKSVPKKEQWLYENPQALKSVLQGLREAGDGKTVCCGTFLQYAQEKK